MSATKVFAAALIHSVASANYILTHLHDFHQLDANHDGTLTRDEYIEVAEETAKTDFDRMDLDGDGIIGEEEYETVVDHIEDAKDNPIEWTESDEANVALLIARMDKDGDFKVTYDEFRSGVPLIFSHHNSVDEINRYFDHWDVYDEGYATFDSVLDWVKLEKKHRDIFGPSDTNHDGLVSWEEFKAKPFGVEDPSDEEELQEVFDKYEPDANGNLVYERYLDVIVNEFKAIKQAVRFLEEMDTNEDDYISRSEIVAFLENQGKQINDEELDAVLERLDANRDGDIHIGEAALLTLSEQVHDYARELLRQKASESITAIVSQLDADGSGHLGFSELQESLLLAEWTDEQIEALLDLVNIEEDGIVRVEEAVEVLIREEMRKISIGRHFYEFTEAHDSDPERSAYFTVEDVLRVDTERSPTEAENYVASQDGNGDGQVTYGEFCRANLEWFMCPPEDEGEPNGPTEPEDEFDTIWYQIDSDRNDQVTWVEFVNSAFIKTNLSEDPAVLKPIFDSVDLNGDGIISKWEAIHSDEHNAGGAERVEAAIANAAEAVFDAIDIDDDGMIDMGEFFYGVMHINDADPDSAALTDAQVYDIFKKYASQPEDKLHREAAADLARAVINSGISNAGLTA